MLLGRVHKLSFVSKPTSVYRGVKEADKGLALTRCPMNSSMTVCRRRRLFHVTSESAEVALNYSGKGPGSIFAIDCNMASRGAPTSFLSQFPHEVEPLFPLMMML